MKNLLVVGDSISIHYRPYLGRMLRGDWIHDDDRYGIDLAQANLDDAIGINSGDSHRTLAMLKAYRQQGLDCFSAILLNCGLHDLRRLRPHGEYQVQPEVYRKNLEKMLAVVHVADQRLFWVRITPVEDARHNALAGFDRYAADVDRYNAAADEVMAAAGVPCIDLFGFVRNLQGEVYCDHVHYTEAVRALQAAFIAGHLQNRFG